MADFSRSSLTTVALTLTEAHIAEWESAGPLGRDRRSVTRGYVVSRWLTATVPLADGATCEIYSHDGILLDSHVMADGWWGPWPGREEA